MERNVMTGCSRARRRSGGLRTWLLAGVSMGALLAAGPAIGQVSADERVYLQEALATRSTRSRRRGGAWRRTYSRNRPGRWHGPAPMPPAATGWQAAWTVRGLEARYCEDTLLVYLAPAALKGTGGDHRAVHAAPHAYGGGEVPVLHWLENGRAEGGAGRALGGAAGLPLGGRTPAVRCPRAAPRSPVGCAIPTATRARA